MYSTPWGIFTQIRASLVYGLRFIPFLLPLGGLAAMAVYGFVLMRVYIRAFRKNESVDEAILTSTKANAAACIWLPLVLGVIIAINFFVSLMQ